MTTVDTILARLVDDGVQGVALASGIGLACYLASESSDVQALALLLRDADTRTYVVAYMRELAADGGDPEYRHQHDEALFGVLYALHKAAPELAYDVACGEWDEAALRTYWFRGFARWIFRSRGGESSATARVQGCAGSTNTMTKKNELAAVGRNTDSPIGSGGLTDAALAALSTFGLGPQATITALTAIDAEKALAGGATKKVLREYRELAQSVGLDLINGDVLDRKPREPKADDGDATEFPSAVPFMRN